MEAVAARTGLIPLRVDVARIGVALLLPERAGLVVWPDSRPARVRA